MENTENQLVPRPVASIAPSPQVSVAPASLTGPKPLGVHVTHDLRGAFILNYSPIGEIGKVAGGVNVVTRGGGGFNTSLLSNSDSYADNKGRLLLPSANYDAFVSRCSALPLNDDHQQEDCLVLEILRDSDKRFVDVRNAPDGADVAEGAASLPDNVASSIYGAAVFIVVVSAEYERSTAGKLQLMYASKLRRAILAVCTPPTSAAPAWRPVPGNWLEFLLKDKRVFCLPNEKAAFLSSLESHLSGASGNGNDVAAVGGSGNGKKHGVLELWRRMLRKLERLGALTSFCASLGVLKTRGSTMYYRIRSLGAMTLSGAKASMGFLRRSLPVEDSPRRPAGADVVASRLQLLFDKFKISDDYQRRLRREGFHDAEFLKMAGSAALQSLAPNMAQKCAMASLFEELSAGGVADGSLDAASAPKSPPRPPGMTLRVSPSAIDKIVDKVANLAVQHLQNLQLKDAEGKSGMAKWWLRNQKVSRVIKGVCSGSAANGVFTLQLRIDEASLTGDWRWEVGTRGKLKMRLARHSGGLEITGRGVVASATVIFQGGTLVVKELSSSLEDLKVKVHSGGDGIYNLILEMFQGDIRRQLERRLSEGLRNALDRLGAGLGIDFRRHYEYQGADGRQLTIDFSVEEVSAENGAIVVRNAAQFVEPGNEWAWLMAQDREDEMALTLAAAATQQHRDASLIIGKRFFNSFLHASGLREAKFIISTPELNEEVGEALKEVFAIVGGELPSQTFVDIILNTSCELSASEGISFRLEGLLTMLEPVVENADAADHAPSEAKLTLKTRFVLKVFCQLGFDEENQLRFTLSDVAVESVEPICPLDDSADSTSAINRLIRVFTASHLIPRINASNNKGVNLSQNGRMKLAALEAKVVDGAVVVAADLVDYVFQ